MGWIEATLQDLARAARGMKRRPGLTVLIAVTLGLGLGVNAALFTVLDRTLLRPLPFEGGDRMGLLLLRHSERGFQRAPFPDELDPILAEVGTIERVELFRWSGGTRPGPEGAEQVSTLDVTHGLLDMLGLSPVRGRDFLPEDAAGGAAPTVMVHEAYWRAKHGSDTGLIGAPLRVNDTVFTVIGVWPAEAQVGGGKPPDLVRVLLTGKEVEPGTFTIPLVRVRDGVSLATASAEAQHVYDGLESRRRNWIASIDPPKILVGKENSRGLWLTFVGVGLLLLVALANVSNLLLGRTVQRDEELAVRLVLGASTLQVVRVLWAEAALQTGLGLAVAAVVSQWMLAIIPTVTPTGVIVSSSIWADPRWVGYALGLGATCCLAITVVPALHLRSSDLRRRLVGHGNVSRSRRSLAGPGLVATQVAITLVLLTGAGLIFRSMGRMAAVDTGFDLERVLVLAMRLPSGSYTDPAERRAFFDRAEEEIASMPEVERVSRASNRPLSYTVSFRVPVLVDAGPVQTQEGEFSTSEGVAPGYFQVMGIPILEGRDFTREDDDLRTVIVNDAFRRRYGGDVIGRQLKTFPEDTLTLTIVGVVGNVHDHGLIDEESDRVQVYYPNSTTERRFERFVIRAAGDLADLVPSLRSRLRQLDSRVLVTPTPGLEYIREATARHRFFVQLLTVFGILGLTLAATGVYAVVSLAVDRRTREIGLRVALGADVGRVLGDVTAAGLRPVVAGGVAGLIGAFLVGRLATTLLYEISPADPISLIGGFVVLAIAAFLACLIPARRASRVDPVIALRAD